VAFAVVAFAVVAFVVLAIKSKSAKADCVGRSSLLLFASRTACSFGGDSHSCWDEDDGVRTEDCFACANGFGLPLGNAMKRSKHSMQDETTRVIIFTGGSGTWGVGVKDMALVRRGNTKCIRRDGMMTVG